MFEIKSCDFFSWDKHPILFPASLGLEQAEHVEEEGGGGITQSGCFRLLSCQFLSYFLVKKKYLFLGALTPLFFTREKLY